MTAQVVPEVRRANRTVDLSKEQQWLAQHEIEYTGEWVVLDGDRLVGHGEDPRPIVAQARLAGVQSPFVHFVAADSDPFMGGWCDTFSTDLFTSPHLQWQVRNHDSNPLILEC